MNRIILVGGGGFCRELIDAVAECNEAGTLPPVGGYIDDGGDVLARYDYDVRWLGAVADYVPRNDDGFIIAVGSPAGKRAVHGRLSARGAIFPNLIHPTARIARTAKLDEGCLFMLATVAGPDCRVERFATVNTGSGLGHDASLGEFSTLSSKVDITGGVQIGSDVSIGSNAVFVPRVRIGNGATVGAGSVVYRSVRAGATVFAPPAKLLKLR